MSRYRAIVVGCGGLGSAALYRLAQQVGPADYQAWEQVEAESGQTIVTRTGGLVIEDRVARREAATGSRNIEGCTRTFDEFGIAYELLDADAVMQCWPQFRLDGSEQAILPPDQNFVLDTRRRPRRQVRRVDRATARRPCAGRQVLPPHRPFLDHSGR